MVQLTRKPRTMSILRTALVATGAAAAVSANVPTFERRYINRATGAPVGISNNPQAFDGQSFDYVVVGGGNAGLVVASRLSEQANLTVAVIEAGASGEQQTSLTTPAANMFNSSVGTDLDWAYMTTPQKGMLGREASWPRGKTLGGSTAINGLYLVRQQSIEQDSWASLLANKSNNAQDIWSWENVLDAMKKSETYTPIDKAADAIISAGDPDAKNSLVPYNTSNHGTHGPIHHSYPGESYEDVGAFLGGISAATGLPLNHDAYGGNNTGPFLSTSSINPSNWTRSFARTGYLDPVQDRPNLHVLTGYQATKINFDKSSPPKATGVTFAASADGQTYTVKAHNEVILSAGVIGSPQLLQLSGVADKSILDPLHIQQVADVPGVGFNLQDHLSTSVKFNPKPNTPIAPSKLTGNATIDSYINSAIAYIPLSKVIGANETESFISGYKANLDKYVNAYDAPDTVKAGFNATSLELANKLYPADVPAIEILLGLTFGSILVECGGQHPASRGTVKINSTSAFDKPAIDPAYLHNEEDQRIMRDGCRLARKIGNTAPLTNYAAEEVTPGTSVQSDDQWNTYISNSSGTEYHPSSSCSMLPLELGGVVDHEFKVYNVQNLRVVDSSVPPLSMSQHLMTITYGMGEMAADMIKAQVNGQGYTPVGGNSTSQTNQNGSGKGSSGGKNPHAAGGNGGSPAGHLSTSMLSLVGTLVLAITLL